MCVNRNFIPRILIFSSFALLALLFVACASQPTQMPEYYKSGQFDYVPETGYIEKADTAVTQAKVQGAKEGAPKEYAMASDKLKESEARFRFDDRRESLFLAQQSAIDARVAIAQAKNAQLEREIQALHFKSEQLQKEVEQNQ